MDHSTEAAMPVTPPHEIFALKHRYKVAEAAASIRALRNGPIFWRGYTSEEELASPVDNDDFSFGSLDSDADSIGEVSVDSDLISNYSQPICGQAQAIQVVTAGKAKVIDMPKSSNVDRSQSIMRQPTQSFRQANSDLIGMYYGRTSSGSNRSRTSSSYSVEEQWPISPTTFAAAEQKGNIRSVRRKPNLTPLQIVPRSESPYEITSVPRVGSPPKPVKSVSFDPSTPSSSHRTSTPPTPGSRRKIHKLSSTFSLRTISSSLKRTSAADRSNSRVKAQPTSNPYSIEGLHTPTRTPSKPLPKMIPRGGNERAPILVLPPCPYDDDEHVDEEPQPTTAWPLMDDVVSIPSPIELHPGYSPTDTATTRARRKSLPAYVSAQV